MDKDILNDEARVYEAVLEHLPHDRFALERLYAIYQLCGDYQKVQECEERLQLIETGEINPDDYHQYRSSLRSKTKSFFQIHSKINKLIESCSQQEYSFFELKENEWKSIRPHLELLIKMRESGFLDTEAYLELCRKLKFSRKSNKHLWKGIVAHFPDCDRLNYQSLLKSMQVESTLE